MQPLRQPGHCRGLPRPGRAEEHHILLARADAALQFRDGGWLVPGGGKISRHVKRRHLATDLVDRSHEPIMRQESLGGAKQYVRAGVS